jgi:hypothetical protein
LWHKDLGRAGRAFFDVTPYAATTYDELQNAMQNATLSCKMLHCQVGIAHNSREKLRKIFFPFGMEAAL